MSEGIVRRIFQTEEPMMVPNNVIGISDKMQKVFKTALKATKSKATIYCAAIPENLLEVDFLDMRKELLQKIWQKHKYN